MRCRAGAVRDARLVHDWSRVNKSMNTGLIIAAFKDIAARARALSRTRSTTLIQDGIHAGLARIYGPNVDAEITIDDLAGDIDMVVLKRVVDRSGGSVGRGVARGGALGRSHLRGGRRNGDPRRLLGVRAQRRHGGQAADRAAGPRRRAAADPGRVLEPRSATCSRARCSRSSGASWC